jgi:NADH:ubiquinone oxidoreductase subunit K
MDTTILRKRIGVWFVIHFVVDCVTAIPLFVIPVLFLSWLGWLDVDPVAARLVSAALFGIGIESFLGRKSSLISLITMLNLKIIWSAAAVAGLGLSLIQNAQGNPVAVWVIFIIFIAFHVLWVYWRVKAGQAVKNNDSSVKVV